MTGDKQETAISIGFSCLLLTRDMQQIIINENTPDGCRAKIIGAKARYGIKPSPEITWCSRRCGNGVDAAISEDYLSTFSNRSPEDGTYIQSLALIIDGNSLVHALNPALEKDVSAL